MNQELADVQAGFRKGKEPEIKLLTSVGSSKKTRDFQKTVYFCFIDYVKVFDCVHHKNCGKLLLRDGNTRPPYMPPEISLCRSRSNN